MTLKFQPAVRSVLMCDFNGFVPPEMVKKRPVIIVSRNRYNNQLVTIVPISTTAPIYARDCHYQLLLNPIPDNADVVCWAKCDMLTTISIERLDRIKVRTPAGREYVVPQIAVEEFECVKRAILCGIGMPHLAR